MIDWTTWLIYFETLHIPLYTIVLVLMKMYYFFKNLHKTNYLHNVMFQYILSLSNSETSAFLENNVKRERSDLVPGMQPSYERRQEVSYSWNPIGNWQWNLFKLGPGLRTLLPTLLIRCAFVVEELNLVGTCFRALGFMIAIHALLVVDAVCGEIRFFFLVTLVF